MPEYPFVDLPGFLEYISFVRLCTPDLYPKREGVEARKQWTVDLAFQGIYSGLEMVARKKPHQATALACRKLVEEAYAGYRAGKTSVGYSKLQEAENLLKKLPPE